LVTTVLDPTRCAFGFPQTMRVHLRIELDGSLPLVGRVVPFVVRRWTPPVICARGPTGIGVVTLDREALIGGELVVEGQLATASNATLRCTVEGKRCVYKPMSGERPLWDFPSYTLSRREVAAFALSDALGWHVVPETVWRSEGPFGPGMCQRWIDGEADVVDLVRPDNVPQGWHTVLRAHDEYGERVNVVHDDRLELQRIALLDVITNNADRKGGHLVRDANDQVWGIDHGVTFAEEDKLRTVLWGWAGTAIPEGLSPDLDAVEQLAEGGLNDVLDPWLSAREVQMTRERMRELARTRTFPHPSDGWPAIPWPVF
jgi:uncharacterized repeat protein (TIGR03843 family)